MKSATIRVAAPGLIEVEGELTFETVANLFKDGRNTINGSSVIRVNLKKVTRTDSAGVALLIEWTRAARRRSAEIEYCDVPDQMRRMINVAGLDGILPVK